MDCELMKNVVVNTDVNYFLNKSLSEYADIASCTYGEFEDDNLKLKKG